MVRPLAVFVMGTKCVCLLAARKPTLQCAYQLCLAGHIFSHHTTPRPHRAGGLRHAVPGAGPPTRRRVAAAQHHGPTNGRSHDSLVISLDAPDDAAVTRAPPPGHLSVHRVDFFRSFVRRRPFRVWCGRRHHALGVRPVRSNPTPLLCMYQRHQAGFPPTRLC